MNLFDKIYMYCERGGNAAFWAEPFNALSNSAFIIAAIVAAIEYARLPAGERRAPEAFLVTLVFIIGVGSFLFHTFATRWASYADIVPIGIFMLAYVAYTLRNFFGFHWLVALIGIGLFILAFQLMGSIPCPEQKVLLPITQATRGRCLNGSIAYVPALIALLGMALALAIRRHPASVYLALAGGTFLISMTARTFDIEVCSIARLSDRPLGTHFIWHLLNGLTLYLLLIAALRHGQHAHEQKHG